VSLIYQFAPTGGGDETGFNDAAITTFNTDIPRAIARESIQNIIDANVDRSGRAKVYVEFTMINIAVKDIPCVDQLRQVLIACRDYVEHIPDGKKFFQQAIDSLSEREDINILKISDYGTTGLFGADDDPKGNFYNLMKSVGSSAKSGNQGGSYGLGKASFFAASAFRTIFVSSIYDNDKYVFMGKSRLVSHRMNDVIRQGNGSLGLPPDQKPVRNKSLIPNIFKREKQGTDIYVLGYLGASTWQEDIVKSVLRNFWFAIQKGSLDVVVGNEKITADSIHELIHKYFPEEDPANVVDENSPLPYFEAYKHRENENNKVFTAVLPTLGEVNLYVLLADNLPKKVAYFRKTGMLTKNQTYHCMRSYAAVFICDNDKGNDILRRMEPPAHDDWTKDSPNAKAEGRPIKEAVFAEKELRDFIRESLRSLIAKDEATTLQIQDLSKYLYLPGDETEETSTIVSGGVETAQRSSPTETGTEIGAIQPPGAPPISLPIRPVVVRERTLGTTDEGTAVASGGEGQPGGGTGGGGGGEGEQTAEPGKEGGGQEHLKILSNIKGRSFANRRKDGLFEHVIILRGDSKTKFDLDLKAGTDDSFDELTIEEARYNNGSPLSVTGSVVKGLEFDGKGITTIRVLFNSHERHSIKITAYESR
jgi:hypothetical protein